MNIVAYFRAIPGHPERALMPLTELLILFARTHSGQSSAYGRFSPGRRDAIQPAGACFLGADAIE